MQPPGRSSTLDAVLPLTLRDCPRARILIESLRAFFPELGTLWVVVPDPDVSTVESALAFDKVRVLGECSVLPELSLYRALYRASVVWRRRPAPWFVQQLLKLAGPAFVGTDAYLTLDADVVCVRPTAVKDLVVQGRAIAQRHRSDLHPEWYAWAERVLGVKRSGWTHGVTPALLHRDAVTLLQEHLASRTGRLVASLEGLLPHAQRSLPPSSWSGYLLRHTPWTEYGLYFTFLEATGRFDRFHRDDAPHRLYDHSVWEREAFDAWRPEALFTATDSPFFCVVQSWLGIPPSAVWERVGPHLLRAGARPLTW